MQLPPLTPEQLVKPRHFELRMSLIFATMLVPGGIHLPYFPLWLETKHFTPEQIAVILSAPMFIRVVTTPLITAFADKARDRVDIYLATVAGALVATLGFFLPATYATVLIVSLIFSVMWTPQTPIADSLALSGVRRFGCDYAKMRIWGSISFLGANLAGGFILARTGAEVVPLILAIAFAVALAVGLWAPRLGRPRLASPLSASSLPGSGAVMSRSFLLFACGSGVIIASHGFLYGFVSIYWKAIGISDTAIGLLWAWGVVSEVFVFMVFGRVFGHLSVVAIMVIAAIAAAVRWAVFPEIWPLGLGVPGFFAVQTLHALSTGLMLIAIQKLIAEAIPEERTGAAQGVAFFANSVSMAVVTLASGPLYERLGVDGFYVMVVIALVGLGLVLAADRSAPKTSAPQGGQGR